MYVKEGTTEMKEASALSWTELIWLRIGTGDRLLWMGQFTLEFHTMREISWLATPEELNSTKMVYYKNHGVSDLHLSHHGSEFRAGLLSRNPNVIRMDNVEYDT
jgi:hypothetical protein